MGELVFVQNDQVVTDSFTVAEVFGKAHDKVVRDIRNQISKLETAGEHEWSVANFGECDYINDSAVGINKNRKYKKINMTEEAFTIVAMAYVTPEAMKMKVKFIQEFKSMRQKLRKELPEMPTHVEALRGWADAIEDKQKLETANKMLSTTIEEQKPKVMFAETCMASNTSILVRELAKLVTDQGIKIGQNRLYRKLRQWGYIMKYCTEPTQRAMDAEYFEVIQRVYQTPEGARTSPTTKVTPKGQVQIIKKLKQKQNVIPMAEAR